MFNDKYELRDRSRTSDRLDRLEKQWQDERRTQRNAYDALRDEKRACEERLQRAHADVKTYQRRNHVLEHEIDRARQTTDIFRGDQPWIITGEEIKLSDKVLGTGAWGRVLEGNFRGTKVAVKEIHEIIQSAHNRFLFDREITFATVFQGWYVVVPMLFLEISILHNDKVNDEYFLSLLFLLKNQILSKRNKFKCHLNKTINT